MTPETRRRLDGFLRAERLADSYRDIIDSILVPLADQLAQLNEPAQPAKVVGICGPQGSGKSTISGLLRLLLEARDMRVALLSLDDLYFPREQRLELAANVHPLFATRGPPGTHDVALGCRLIGDLRKAASTSIPRFDKASDSRMAPEKWEHFTGPADLILFEGWCVGARAQPGEALAQPINGLERDRDPQGIWRGRVNQMLEADYPDLFDLIDFLVYLKPPSFQVVAGWRREQEAKLRAARPQGARIMSDAEVDLFVQHYERLTRHMLEDLPKRADLVLALDEDRRPRLPKAAPSS